MSFADLRHARPRVLACAALALGLGALLPARLVAASGGISSQPFEPRTAPRGPTLFTTLAPEQTGIRTENTYADPRMWGEKHLEYAVGSIGTGVAIGDYDNDGRPDVFVVSKTDRSKLFRNLGGWRFEDTTVAAGLDRDDSAPDPGVWKQGAAFADVNNDGWLDLYQCRVFAPNQLFINQGDGTFREEAAARGLAVEDASGTGAFCDYDRDGWLDVFIQTNMFDAARNPTGQRDRLFRNTGDGRFVEVTAASGISGPTLSHSATWWDYNHDGWPDMYAASDFSPPDALYRNNGDGTFTNVVDAVAPHTPYSSMGADLGDVNNDGLVDLLVADMATTTHEKDQRGMASARALSREDQGRPELAPQYLRNALLLSTGTDALQEAAILAGISATDWTWSVRLEDFDQDGRLDLHLTNGMTREFQNADLRERIILSENLGERMRLLRESPVLNERNIAFRNAGDLRFEDVSTAWGLDHDGVSFGTACGDLDGDGDLDLVYGNYEATASVLRNDADAGHAVIFALRGTRSNRFGVGAIVRIETASGVQVRPLVLARGYLSTSEPVLHFGLGADDRILRATVSWPSGHEQTFADLAADCRYTITEPDEPASPGGVGHRAGATPLTDVSSQRGLDLPTRETFRAEPNRQPLMPTTFHRRGPGLALADLDGDGRDELLLGGTSRDGTRIVSGLDGAPASEPPRTTPLATEANVPDGPSLLFDADADGDVDALLTKTGAGIPAASPRLAPKLWLNDGSGTLQPAPEGVLPATPISAGAVAAADFDRDGRLDVFMGARVLPGRYPAAPRSLLLANRAAGFEDVAETIAPGLAQVGMVTSALWSDLDDDGWLDLLVALEWGGVRAFRNRQGTAFEEVSEPLGFAAAGSGWWNSLVAADFNGDGRLDYAAGNQGLNSPYSASKDRPALLFVGSFADTPARQLVEAYHEGDRIYPRHTLKALAEAIPPLKRRIRRNNEYATATLEQVLGPEKLAAAERFAATEFRTGVFLSGPDGRFRFEPLPNPAQISVTQGMVAGDFDGDGRADLVAVHNNFSPVHAIGRFDGGIGQLLLGDGRGGFRAVAPRESGFVVPGDAKALVVLDLGEDGVPDLLCSRNNSTTLAFRNDAGPGRRFLAVRLRGAQGNRTAIGSRVTLRAAGGAAQVAEITAGSGYWSQSSAACFFGYPEEDPPRRVDVRWPDGSVTTHDVPAATRVLRVEQP